MDCLAAQSCARQRLPAYSDFDSPHLQCSHETLYMGMPLCLKLPKAVN